MICSVINLKGGVGKTTTATSVAASLRNAGKKVLLVDLDSQGSLTRGLYRGTFEYSIGDLLFGQSTFDDTVITTSVGLDILPANLDVAAYERNLSGLPKYHTYLSKALKPVAGRYDYIIIDCPPSLGNMTVNALFASDYYIVPVLTDFYSLEGIKAIVSTANKVTELNTKLELLGVVVTRYNRNDRKIVDRHIYEQLQEVLKDKLFDTTIRVNNTFKDAVINSMDIFSFDTKCNGAVDYKMLTDEILLKIS